jgi:hypothetical protein
MSRHICNSAPNQALRPLCSAWWNRRYAALDEKEIYLNNNGSATERLVAFCQYPHRPAAASA